MTWDESSASTDDWKKLSAQAKELAKLPQGAQVTKTVGDVDTGLSTGKSIEAFYTFGFISHAPLEPQNTTAWYQKDAAGDKLEIWGSVQIPDGARTLAAKVVGVPQERSTLHQLRIGGGFGRRLMHEYACEAAAISKQAGGVPVKLMWTREDDMSHDFYRPGGFHQFKAAVDAQGKLSAWSGHAISFTENGRTASRVAVALTERVPGGIHAELPHVGFAAAAQDSVRSVARARLQHGGVRRPVVHA